MASNATEIEEAFDQLISWTKTLLSTTDSAKAQVLGALDPSSKPLEGSPSRASTALLIFNGVLDRHEEVKGYIKEIYDLIQSSDA